MESGNEHIKNSTFYGLFSLMGSVSNLVGSISNMPHFKLIMVISIFFGIVLSYWIAKVYRISEDQEKVFMLIFPITVVPYILTAYSLILPETQIRNIRFSSWFMLALVITANIFAQVAIIKKLQFNGLLKMFGPGEMYENESKNFLITKFDNIKMDDPQALSKFLNECILESAIENRSKTIIKKVLKNLKPEEIDKFIEDNRSAILKIENARTESFKRFISILVFLGLPTSKKSETGKDFDTTISELCSTMKKHQGGTDIDYKGHLDRLYKIKKGFYDKLTGIEFFKKLIEGNVQNTLETAEKFKEGIMDLENACSSKTSIDIVKHIKPLIKAWKKLEESVQQELNAEKEKKVEKNEKETVVNFSRNEDGDDNGWSCCF